MWNSIKSYSLCTIRPVLSVLQCLNRAHTSYAEAPVHLHIYKSYHLPSLILTARASCGKLPLKLGPSDQLFRSRRCVSKAGLMSH